MSFERLPHYFNVEKLKAILEASELWGEFDQRGQEGSPHVEMVDIWARFRDPRPYIESGDWTGFIDEHDSVWLHDIPGLKDIAYKLMQLVDGGQLGGVLITKLPPGGQIYPHIDNGWHAAHYEKYYIPIKNKEGAKFCFECGEIEPAEGTVWRFRNDVLHWVVNESNVDRIALIVCIRKGE